MKARHSCHLQVEQLEQRATPSVVLIIDHAYVSPSDKPVLKLPWEPGAMNNGVDVTIPAQMGLHELSVTIPHDVTVPLPPVSIVPLLPMLRKEVFVPVSPVLRVG